MPIRGGLIPRLAQIAPKPRLGLWQEPNAKGTTMNEVATLRPMLPATTGEGDTLPHNIEAEQQLLGAILTNNDVYDRIASLVKPCLLYTSRCV